MSRADQIFIDNCREILDHGHEQRDGATRPHWEDGSPAYTRKAFGIVNRYDLAEEFPILTLRPINFRAAVDEILWIWQKKSNRVADLGSRIWDSWAGPDGTIGKAYGYQLGIKHIYREGLFDQVDRVLFDLRNNPQSRRIMTNIYNHADLHAMNLYPCAYSMTFNVVDGRLCAILNQRSQDMLVANSWNVTQYAALIHLMAKVTGHVPGELVHVIADAHIYDRHVPLVERLLNQPQYPAPALQLNPAVDDYYACTPEDFTLAGYQHGPSIGRIPVAI